MARFGEFRDDDAGYLAWLADHAEGYVINIARNHNVTQARLHLANCHTIRNQNSAGSTWTGPYVKVCADDLAELDKWAIETVGQPISPCGTCRPASGTVQTTPTKQRNRTVDDAASTVIKPPEPPMADPRIQVRSDTRGPSEDGRVVEAWADDYIRFGSGPVWQDTLRSGIRSRCGQLVPSDGQVLHAVFFGPKLSNADVENLALYNMHSSFSVPGSNGIRFEHGVGAPLAPDGTRYRFGYQYALVPRSDAFTHWQQGRTLASFDWTDLGAFDGEKKLAKAWLALRRGHAAVFRPATPATPFAVRVQIRSPHGRQPVLGNLVKGVFDGVICAFQAHTDATVLPAVVARLAKYLTADPAEIEEHLLDQRRAVLGVVPRLVSPYRDGVKWDPADHWCVAGELLRTESVDRSWAVRGELIEVTR